MLSAATWDVIHDWTARRLGCAPERLRTPGVITQGHGPALTDYQGIYVWLMGDAAIVSAPTGWLAVVRTAIAGRPATALVDADLWLAALGASVERVVGPSYQGFVDSHTFSVAPPTTLAPGARLLTSEDRPALERFAAACPQEDWTHSAIAFDHQPVFGLERDGALVALASAPIDEKGEASVWRPLVRSVGVVTLPAWRGMGAGRAVVSALTAYCLAGGATLRYQTLRSNGASVAIARALGYVDVATALAVRVRASDAYG